MPPEEWQFADARELFHEPEVHKNVEAPKWKSPDVEECVKFLHEEKGFAEDRIRNGLKRMEKSKGFPFTKKQSENRLQTNHFRKFLF